MSIFNSKSRREASEFYIEQRHKAYGDMIDDIWKLVEKYIGRLSHIEIIGVFKTMSDGITSELFDNTSTTKCACGKCDTTTSST